ncbi:MAG: serpin family protein [Verrucomicrobiota bacterium]
MTTGRALSPVDRSTRHVSCVPWLRLTLLIPTSSDPALDPNPYPPQTRRMRIGDDPGAENVQPHRSFCNSIDGRDAALRPPRPRISGRKAERRLAFALGNFAPLDAARTAQRAVPTRLSAAVLRTCAAAVLMLLQTQARAAGSADQQKLAAANNSFAFKLLKQLAKDQPGTNIFISPFSASTALQMVCNGAGGQTLAEMQRVLGTAGMQPKAVNEASYVINESLNSRDTNVTLTTANAIWYRKGITVKPEFLACNRQFFGATVDALDFDNPLSADVMNAWAKGKTRGHIKSIVNGPIDNLTQLFLANAVYFKGKWEEPFKTNITRDRVFHLRGGVQETIPMMEQSREFMYRRGTGYQAVRLPYQGWGLGMYVFLPDPGSSPEQLLDVLNGAKWQRVTEPGFSEQKGTVVLPRFKLEYGVELKPTLTALGMKTAFGDADFSGIAARSTFISAVQQRTFVEVNEEGTEAAAVTLAPVSEGIEMPPTNPFEMIVDRPFLFLIEDKQTGTILFMGIVSDPKG